MKLLTTITEKEICGTNDISNKTPREAVRAILIDEAGQIAILYMEKYDLYTVPGGGVEDDESFEEAVKREVLEETGCKCEIIYELGSISENRAAHDFTQISYYYVAKVIGEKGSPQMTQEEIDEMTQVQWHTPQNALDIILNEKPLTNQQKFIQYRDRVVLEEFISYLAINKINA